MISLHQVKKHSVRWRKKSFEEWFQDEHGSTTLSMAVSLLITLALIFTSAHVYRVNTRAAEVQDVADACALSAENQVGEFMIAVQFCDATVLSLSLLGLATTGLGVVALCIPPTAGLARNLIEAGHKIFQTRDSFAQHAAQALNKLQKALPYIAAVSAANVAAGNNANAEGSHYFGIALLVKGEGDPIEIEIDDAATDLLSDIDDRFDRIEEKAKQADDAAKIAQEAKQRAYEHDCGNSPSYCMYERAERLAAMMGFSNPYFGSVDTWSFSNALERARVYYRVRLQNEVPLSGTVEECARSALRKIFYAYANEQMSSAYVHETSESFEAYFPHLPRNTQEMRRTRLYTDNTFPLTQTEGGRLMLHAWSGCPEIDSIVGWGSLSLMESEELPVCPTCSCTAASLGKVAAASTAIENGFEYHYEIVATQADRYQKAYQELKGPKSEVQEEVSNFLGRIGELCKSAFGKRITASPPGRYGAIAFVVNSGSVSASEGFQNAFVQTGGILGPCAALSAATLVGEDSNEGKNVINSLLDGLASDDSVVVGASRLVLGAWSFVLHAYTEGNEALANGIRSALDSIPLVGPSGLGSWASKKFSSGIESLGLQPADLRAFKAVLVNSEYVAQRGDDAFSQNYVKIKRRITTAAIGASDVFSIVLNDAQIQALHEIESMGDSVEIASIELFGPGDISIPVTIPLPKALKSSSISIIESLFQSVRSVHAQTAESGIWK